MHQVLQFTDIPINLLVLPLLFHPHITEFLHYRIFLELLLVLLDFDEVLDVAESFLLINQEVVLDDELQMLPEHLVLLLLSDSVESVAHHSHQHIQQDYQREKR